jgi:hypothetical protein
MRPTYAIRLLRDALKIEREWLEVNVTHQRYARRDHTATECSSKDNVRFLRRRIAHLEAALKTLEG